MTTSDHANLRMQQRGVSENVLAALMRVGRIRRKGGIRIVYYDRSARSRRSRPDCNDIAPQTLDKLRGLYAVLGENDKLVTVSHRTKQFRFD